jgi:hypothetical protein
VTPESLVVAFAGGAVFGALGALVILRMALRILGIVLGPSDTPN